MDMHSWASINGYAYGDYDNMRQASDIYIYMHSFSVLRSTLLTVNITYMT